MDNDYFEYVPRKLDAPARFLLWDFDTVAVGAAGFGIGIIVNSILVGSICTIACIWAWTRIKAGRHPRYGFHFLYWHTPIKPFKRTPASSKRHFNG